MASLLSLPSPAFQTCWEQGDGLMFGSFSLLSPPPPPPPYIFFLVHRTVVQQLKTVLFCELSDKLLVANVK